MKSHKSIFISTILLLSSNALAVCDREREEYEDWKSRCDTFTSITGIAFTVGTAATTHLGGIGGLIGGPPGLVANNACRIMEEKKSNLDRCHASIIAAATTKANKARYDVSLNKRKALAAQEHVRRQQEYSQKICKIGSECDALVKQAEQEFQDDLYGYISNLIREGYNLDTEETLKMIEDKRKELSNRLQDKLSKVQGSRAQRVKQTPVPANLLSLPAQFGCYRNYCWAYKTAFSKAGDPWCYTQTSSGQWASCSSDHDCAWEMECGDNVLRYGAD